MRLFANRMQAAQELSQHLSFLKDEHPVVIGLANGGVLMGDIVASSLQAPLDVMIIEKLVTPQSPGQCVGVVDEHGRVSLLEGSSRWHHLTHDDLTALARVAFPEVHRRHNAIRAILPETEIRGRNVILVDDGVASGAKMLGAVAAAKERGAARITAAAPAGASKGTWQLHACASQVVIPHRPTKFEDVSHFYEDFSEVTDQMVVAILQGWVNDHHPQDHGGIKTVALKLANSAGQALLCEVDLPRCLKRGERYPAVVFAHGFDSSARSSRSMAISERLAERGIVGVRMDFTGHGRSGGNIADANERQMRDDLGVVMAGVRRLKEVDHDRLAIVGSGVGALIALHHAEQDSAIRALVLRDPVGNLDFTRPDAVRAPTLLIHAEDDLALLQGVETLDRQLAAQHTLVRVPNTNRLFSDPAGLDRMVCATVDWLTEQLSSGAARPLAAGEPQSVVAG
jgi:putative phosphoribosyl transferase